MKIPKILKIARFLTQTGFNTFITFRIEDVRTYKVSMFVNIDFYRRFLNFQEYIYLHIRCARKVLGTYSYRFAKPISYINNRLTHKRAVLTNYETRKALH